MLRRKAACSQGIEGLGFRVVSIFFSTIPILPQDIIVVTILFSIIPILPQDIIVVSILFSIVPGWGWDALALYRGYIIRGYIRVI